MDAAEQLLVQTRSCTGSLRRSVMDAILISEIEQIDVICTLCLFHPIDPIFLIIAQNIDGYAILWLELLSCSLRGNSMLLSFNLERFILRNSSGMLPIIHWMLTLHIPQEALTCCYSLSISSAESDSFLSFGGRG